MLTIVYTKAAWRILKVKCVHFVLTDQSKPDAATSGSLDPLVTPIDVTKSEIRCVHKLESKISSKFPLVY